MLALWLGGLLAIVVALLWWWPPRGKRLCLFQCPICDGKGVTGLTAASGAPQRCGVCHGTGKYPGPLA
jgi:hypothetical protein